MIEVCVGILSRQFAFNEQSRLLVFNSIVNGTKINTHNWIPSCWIVPSETTTQTHQIEQVGFASEMNSVNAPMRIDPYLGIANRSVDVYDTLIGALSSLCTLTGKTPKHNECPLSYASLKEQFAELAAHVERDDVACVFRETLQTLERIQNKDDQPRTKKSIVDPIAPRLRGPRATGTSARVDHVASVPRTKMIQDHVGQGNSKPKSATRKRHTCPVCLLQGHHARTCKNMTLEENAGRLALFIEKTIKTGGLKTFVKSLTSRSDKAYARAVLQKVRQYARIDVEDLL